MTLINVWHGVYCSCNISHIFYTEEKWSGYVMDGESARYELDMGLGMGETCLWNLAWEAVCKAVI